MTWRELKTRLDYLSEDRLDQKVCILDGKGRADMNVKFMVSEWEYYISHGCNEAVYTKSEVQQDVDLGFSGWEDYDLFAPKGGFYLEID